MIRKRLINRCCTAVNFRNAPPAGLGERIAMIAADATATKTKHRAFTTVSMIERIRRKCGSFCLTNGCLLSTHTLLMIISTLGWIRKDPLFLF